MIDLIIGFKTNFQKKQATIRVINQLNKWINITDYWFEDVAINIKALTNEYNLYRWKNPKINYLDNNIRKIVLMRDNYKCKECGKINVKLEVHHIIPRRLYGSTTLDNLISLCINCHNKTKGVEEQYINKYKNIIGASSKIKFYNYASHTMIGKHWLRKSLQNLGTLYLTNGGDTANKRIDWNINKTHSNDAICITNLYPNTIDIKDWIIKPIRKKSKAKTNNVLGIRHRDLVEYTYRNGKTYRGYVTALYPDVNALNFQSLTKHCKRVNAKKCKLLWKFNNIYWLENVA